MVNDVLNDLQSEMKQALESLNKDLSRMRTGRANLAILDGIRVDYYGASTPLNQVASLHTPEPRLIMIKPWEKSMVPVIEKAIQAADLGFNPSNDGEVVRIPIPPLTEQRRQELVKLAKKTGEEYKIQIRRIRREANDMLKELEKSKDISEDDMHRAMDDVQKHTDEHIKKVDERIAEKEKEILEI
jgi:ribosome recycling factor